MKSKDLFNLAIRILGLVFLYQGLSSLPTVVLAALSNGSGNLIMFVLMVIWQMLLAYWLLRGAPFIMNIAYPESSVTPNEATRLQVVPQRNING